MRRRSLASWSQYLRRGVPQGGADQVDHAGLHDRCGKTAFTESGRPLSPSQTMKNTSRHAAVLQVGQHVHPELRRLPAALAGPQAEHVAAPVQVDADRGVERLVADLPVADLDVDRVDEDRRVHALQRPGGPGAHLLEHLVGDPGDRVLADGRAVHLVEVRGDLAGGQALGEQADRDRVHVRQAPLALLDDHRLERAGPVPRHRDAHLPGGVGEHRLGPGAVADVARSGGGCLVFLVAEVLGQLLLQRGLQDGRGDRLEQPVRAGQVLTAGPGGLDQLPDRGLLGLAARGRLLHLLRHRAHARDLLGHHVTFPAGRAGVSGQKHRLADSPRLYGLFTDERGWGGDALRAGCWG